MGIQAPYQPHKLIIAILSSSDLDVNDALQIVHQSFGVIDSRTDPRPFEFTEFYTKEMGRPLTRVLASIDQLVDPADLAVLKLRANGLETESARKDGSRRLNLDPGLLSLSRLILATTKPSAHRIAIGEHMYAEITLLYRKGRFAPLEWTYPDFESGLYDEWLRSVRGRYHEQLQEIDPGRAWRL